MEPYYFLLLYIPIFALLNRASGYDDWFIGRNIYATSLLAGVAGCVLTTPAFGFILFATMLFYRIPGWQDLLDVGTDEGDPLKEAVLMSFRQALVAPIFVFVAFQTGDWLIVMDAFIFGIMATAIYHTCFSKGPWFVKRGLKPGGIAEWLVGGLLGAFIAPHAYTIGVM